MNRGVSVRGVKFAGVTGLVCGLLWRSFSKAGRSANGTDVTGRDEPASKSPRRKVIRMERAYQVALRLKRPRPVGTRSGYVSTEGTTFDTQELSACVP